MEAAYLLGEKPPMEVVQQMRAFIGEYAQTGKFLEGEGLGASKTRTRLVFREGRATVKYGPYRGENELPAAMLVLRVRTRDEAIGWAERYGTYTPPSSQSRRAPADRGRWPPARRDFRMGT